MTKCKDGRKHIVVQSYTKKDGGTVKAHERGCPTRDPSHEETYICCLCGEQYGFDELHEVHVKGETKNICDECVDTVHGLL